MSQEYQIRQATFQDAPALARLQWERAGGEAAGAAFDDFCDGFTRFLNEAFCRNNWNVWGAEADGRLVACVFVHQVLRVPRPGQTHDRWGLMTDFYVLPAMERQSVGADLLDAVIAWALEQGLEFLRVTPGDGDASLSERSGFVRTDKTLELTL